MTWTRCGRTLTEKHMAKENPTFILPSFCDFRSPSLCFTTNSKRNLFGMTVLMTQYITTSLRRKTVTATSLLNSYLRFLLSVSMRHQSRCDMIFLFAFVHMRKSPHDKEEPVFTEHDCGRPQSKIRRL